LQNNIIALDSRGRPVFHAKSELVLIHVEVIHTKTNTRMGQLQAKDFSLWEDGEPQTISFLDHDQFALSVMLLFDLTDSVRVVLRRLAAGARSALDRLKPEDEVWDLSAARREAGCTTHSALPA
jgi:hypothetical protein